MRTGIAIQPTRPDSKDFNFLISKSLAVRGLFSLGEDSLIVRSAAHRRNQGLNCGGSERVFNAALDMDGQDFAGGLSVPLQRIIEQHAMLADRDHTAIA